MASRLHTGIVGGTRTKRLFLALLIIAIFWIVFIPRQAQILLQNLGKPIASLLTIPIQGLANLDRGVRDLWNHYLALQGVHEQNIVLQGEIDQLRGALNQLREQALAVERLSTLLKFQRRLEPQTIAARVIGRNTSNWYQALILDKGEADGLARDMGVMTPAGVVGKIIKTHSSSSIVLLLTNRNIAIASLVQRTRDEGIVQGMDRGRIRIKYLPPLSSVQPNDQIVTSGLTGGFPRGLLIGHINHVTEHDGALFQSADLVPAVDFRKLEEVLIIVSPQPATPSNDDAPTLSPLATSPPTP
ncbi:MAG: rod shape-determining protein MreC [Nitrospirales bacterium]|nr:rod shape-determining protein MreC [Nitrospirales bacterium]NKB82777.1 rod shape-determining protein MreC [Nitrospirales bacterium]